MASRKKAVSLEMVLNELREFRQEVQERFFHTNSQLANLDLRFTIFESELKTIGTAVIHQSVQRLPPVDDVGEYLRELTRRVSELEKKVS